MAITYDTMNGRALLPHSGSLLMHTAEATFRRAHPIFEGTSLLDELRTTEYAPAHDNVDLFWWPFCDQFWVKSWDRTETEITAYLIVQSHPVDSVSFKRQG